jgi:hypothetical protein
MHRRLTGCLALALSLLSLPLYAADKKDDDKAKDEADKLVNAGQVTGVLRSLPDGSQKYLSINIPVAIPTGVGQNPVVQQQMLLQYQQQLMRTPPWQRQQVLLQMLIQLRNSQGAGVEVRQIPVDLQAADEMKVRTLVLPPKYDDKGKITRYSNQELKEMRGNSNLPGYAAEMDSLHTGQTVVVYLAKPKAPPKPAAKKEKNDLEDDKPIARAIVIMSEPPGGK